MEMCIDRRIAICRYNSEAVKSYRKRLRAVWRQMYARCENANNKDFRNYGFRGIRVCSEWRDVGGFDRFFDWCLANGYKPGLTIDRLNVDDGYSPSNCRLATRLEQAQNKTNTRRFYSDSLKGFFTITEYSIMSGESRDTTIDKVMRGFDPSLPHPQMTFLDKLFKA